jgi:hypothetical protein
MKQWKSNSILLLSAICIAPHLRAQATAAAPLPSQLTSATTAFLANAGLDNTDSLEAYNTFYQGLYTWNHFKLQPTPAEAELTFELQVNGMITNVNGGSSNGVTYLRLVIRDTKTGALLWSLLENVRPAAREKTLITNIDAAAAKLLTDLKAVTSAPTSTHP